MFVGFQYQETTPTSSLYVNASYWGVSFPLLIFVKCSALEKRKILHPTKISRYGNKLLSNYVIIPNYRITRIFCG